MVSRAIAAVLGIYAPVHSIFSGDLEFSMLLILNTANWVFGSKSMFLNSEFRNVSFINFQPELICFNIGPVDFSGLDSPI